MQYGKTAKQVIVVFAQLLLVPANRLWNGSGNKIASVLHQCSAIPRQGAALHFCFAGLFAAAAQAAIKDGKK